MQIRVGVHAVLGYFSLWNREHPAAPRTHARSLVSPSSVTHSTGRWKDRFCSVSCPQRRFLDMLALKFQPVGTSFFWVRVAFYSTCSSVICGSLWPIELPGDWTLSNAKHLFSQKIHACICISWKLLTKVCGGGGAVISCAMRKGRTSRLSFLWRWWRLACSWFVSRHLLLGCWENRLAPSTREVWSKGHSDVALTPMVMTF